ncbi:MAG: hypothetical protein ABIG44_02715, partial [Planctomycetota bacterium]
MQQHLPAPPLGIMPEGRMPQGLLELVKNGDLDGFEARCLELLETGELPLARLPQCFELIARAGQAERIATLGQMILENVPPGTAPAEILPLACAALAAVPRNEDIRQITIKLYKDVHSQTPGFNAIMESSGLTTGGAARTALRVLDFCLSLNVGDTLISRMDDRVVEVKEVDRDRGLFTLRRDDRTTTIPAREVIREYERVMADDFRVLRQLYPERLSELINDKPVALVIGLIRSHGDLLDADQLKHELAPKYIDQKDWSKWWTRARAKLRRDPHVVIEGRSPVVLSYNAAGISHEEETWEAFQAQKEPVKWVKLVTGYLREQQSRKQTPDSALLERFRDHILQHIATVRTWRAGEALAAALVLQHLGAHGMPGGDAGHTELTKILQSVTKPAQLINELPDDTLWKLALSELPSARPDDWMDSLVMIIPQTNASRLDTLVTVLGQEQRLDAIQQLIDDALADPVDAPEAIYWLWKGPKKTAGLNLPTDVELFRIILDTLSALGATLAPPPEVGRAFRNRVKAA